MPRITIALLIALTVLPALAHAQESKPRTIPFDGIEVFCQILFHEGLQPIASLDELARDQKDTVLIVLGNPGRMPEIEKAAQGLAKFLAQGGNLLVATDYPLATDLSLGIHREHIVQARQSAYHQTPECPWLPSAGGGDHPLFRSLRKGIATNWPSSVVVQPNRVGVVRLLKFPEDVAIDPDVLGPKAYMAGSPKDAPPHGRVLFIAGQGMFMNGMMLQTNAGNFDNDNFDFAVNAIRWLHGGPDGERTKAMLMVDGKIVTKFNMSLAPAVALPPPQIPIPPVSAFNRLIRGMEEEHLFHKMLRGILGDSYDRVIGVLIALATFGLLLYGAKKVLEGRFQRETGVPRMVGTAPPLDPGLKRGQQRQLALYQQADLAKESGQLVRAWLTAEFGVQPQQWQADRAAIFQASGFLWTRWALQRQADEVLRVARGAGVVPVSRSQFARLIDTLKALTEARMAGRLALLVDGKNVHLGPGQHKSL